MMLALLATLAQYERELINERAAEARAAARARGRQVGRPRALTTEKIQYAGYLRDQGKTVPEICTELGISRATYFRHVPAPATGGAAPSPPAT